MAMTRTENLKLVISGDGKLLGAELGKSENRVRMFGTRMRGVFGGIGRQMASSIKHVAMNPLAIFGGAGAILYAAKNIIDYDAALTRLSIKSGLTAKEQMKMREEITRTSFATGKSRMELLSGLMKMREETGSLSTARDFIEDIAIASQTTGESTENIANLTGQLNDKLKLNKKEIREALNLLQAQGQIQGFDLGDLSTNAERIFAAASRFSMSGMKDFRSFTAFLSTAKESIGSPTRSVAAIENILQVLSEKKGAFGFNFTDDKGQLKDIETIIKGILKVTGGDQKKLDKLFGPRSARAFSDMAKEFKEKKTFTIFESFKTADASKMNELMQQFSRYTETADFQVKQLLNGLTEFADSALAPVIKELTASLKELTSNPEKIEQFRGNLEAIAKATGFLAQVLAKPFIFAGKMLDQVQDQAEVWGASKGLSNEELRDLQNRMNRGERTNMKDYLASKYEKFEERRQQSSAMADAMSSDRFSEYLRSRSPAIGSPTATPVTPLLKNNVNISVSYTPGGPLVAQTSDPNTTVKANRGNFD